MNSITKTQFKIQDLTPLSYIDSGQGIANRVVQLCDSLSKSESDAGHNSSLAVFTDLDALVEPFIEKIHKLGFKETLELS